MASRDPEQGDPTTAQDGDSTLDVESPPAAPREESKAASEEGEAVPQGLEKPAKPVKAAKEPKEVRKERKRRRKDERRAADRHRPLDSWERYRAMVDTLEDASDLIDLADHKARFALVIMGALNAILLIAGTRAEIRDAVPEGLRTYGAIYLGVYAFVAVYFVMQAIESLRPRKSHPVLPYPGEAAYADFPMGLRFYEDILERDLEAYRRAWREVHIGQLNAELAVQLHGLARINQAKYAALRRLYAGLQILTLMGALALTVGASFAILGGREPKLKSGKPGKGGLSLLPTPQRLLGTGAKEPSGIAFQPVSGHLFLAGDEGRLVELDENGAALRSDKLGGNLEDVAVHIPSGLLVLLSEKKAELVVWDPIGHAEVRRVKIEQEAVLGQAPGDKNQGFEGLAFRPLAGEPGGGLFYLVHQRNPALLVAIAFDPLGTATSLGAESVRQRSAFPGHQDLAAVTWVPSLNRLLVIAEQEDRILLVRPDGSLEEQVVLPGLRQEGLAFDGRGDLWVADDRGGLLRFGGALAALKAGLAALAAAAGPPAP